MKSKTRNALIVVGGLAVLIGFTVAASRRDGSGALPVATEHIAYRTFAVKLPENGVVMRPQTVTVPTLVAGNIHTIDVKAGDRVSVGELLATIDNPTLDYEAAGSQADYNNSVANVQTARIDEQNARVQYQAQVATAKSNLDEARRVYAADIALLSEKAIARSQVDADKAKLDQAQVAYDQAIEELKLGAVSGYGQDSVQAAQAAAEKARILNRQNQQQLAFTRVVSPIDGVVQTVASESGDNLRSLENGDAVTAGEALFTVAGSSGFIVKAQVDEQDVINVRNGQRVDVTGEDFPGKTIQGHILRVDPVAQKSSDAASTAKQVLTTIALDDSPAFLRDGMNADVDIWTTDVPRALVVDNVAIGKDGRRSYVYEIIGGKVTKRYVTLGRAGDSQTIVTSGVDPGDTIVDQNPSSTPALKDGTSVTPLPSPTASPTSA